jgi:glycosyltransferase involved in cell wall biosynthesis
MNILIIPSWYPVDDNKNGQFFRNEAHLVSRWSNVTLIFVSVNYVKRRSIKSLFKFIRFRKKPRLQRFSNENFLEVIITLELWPSKKRSYPINYVTSYIKNFIEYEKLQFDIIHAHSTLFGGIIAKNLSCIWGIPFIITEHQHIPFLLNQINNSDKLVSILNSASKVLAVSKYQKQQLLSFGVNNQIDVVGNFINELVFKLDNEFSSVSIFTILYIAYDGYIKDFSTFSDTIYCLQNLIPQFEVIIITSKNNTNIEKFLRTVDVSKVKVEVFYGINNVDMPPFYHRSTVFVSTSIAETFGVAHVESLFCGIPVISTNSGGIMDFLNINNSIILEIQDSQAIAQAIFQVYIKKKIFDPVQLRESVNRYSSSFFLEYIYSIYKNLLN